MGCLCFRNSLKESKPPTVNDLVVATTDLNQDKDAEEWCKQNEIGCYRGSADGILGRLTSAAKHFNCSTVVEVLGDNPLVHCELIDSCLIKYFLEITTTLRH